MNDCIWYWIYVCDADECNGCKQHISANCKLGEAMCEAYEKDVNKALEPVREKWAKKME